MPATKVITVELSDGSNLDVRIKPLTWRQLKDLRTSDDAPADAVINLVVDPKIAEQLQDAYAPDVKLVIETIWDLTTGTEESAGN